MIFLFWSYIFFYRITYLHIRWRPSSNDEWVSEPGTPGINLQLSYPNTLIFQHQLHFSISTDGYSFLTNDTWTITLFFFLFEIRGKREHGFPLWNWTLPIHNRIYIFFYLLTSTPPTLHWCTHRKKRKLNIDTIKCWVFFRLTLLMSLC